MVLERLLAKEFIHGHKYYIFFISMVFAFFSISGSYLLFRDMNPSTISVGLICLFFIVTLHDALKADSIFSRTKRNVGARTIISCYEHVAVIFFYMFMGTLVVFTAFSMLVPDFAAGHIFGSQFEHLSSETATDLFQNLNIFSITANNIAVLLVCLLTSLLFGLSTFYLFIIVWNASVFGVVFGIIAKQTAALSSYSPSFVIMIILIAALPHMILEIFAYLLAGIVGEGFSEYFLMNKKDKDKYFDVIVLNSLSIFTSMLLLFAAALIEIGFAPFIIDLFLPAI